MNNFQPNFMNQPYNMYGFQPIQQPMQQPIQRSQTEQQFATQSIMNKSQNTLQGKLVDNVEVVKATDIPLDYSVSYFPLTDNSAIVTKQLTQDGTSKITIYKPVEENTEKPIKYITQEELDESLKKLDNVKELKEELRNVKRQIKDIYEDIKELNEDMKK